MYLLMPVREYACGMPDIMKSDVHQRCNITGSMQILSVLSTMRRAHAWHGKHKLQTIYVDRKEITCSYPGPAPIN